MTNNYHLHKLSLEPYSDKKKIYNNWAESYEEYVKKLKYEGPKSLVLILNKFISNYKEKNWNILDFGCGTGLLGLELQNKFSQKFNLDGIDLSSRMIEKSKEKNIYTHLWNIDIGEQQIDNLYDIIVSSGVFLEGHAHFKLINSLIDITKSNGLLFITIRKSYINKNKKIYDIYVKNNKRIKIINIIDIKYLPEVTCNLIIAEKI